MVACNAGLHSDSLCRADLLHTPKEKGAIFLSFPSIRKTKLLSLSLRTPNVTWRQVWNHFPLCAFPVVLEMVKGTFLLVLLGTLHLAHCGSLLLRREYKTTIKVKETFCSCTFDFMPGYVGDNGDPSWGDKVREYRRGSRTQQALHQLWHLTLNLPGAVPNFIYCYNSHPWNRRETWIAFQLYYANKKRQENNYSLLAKDSKLAVRRS